MRYVEESCWENMTPVKVNYDDYDTAIKAMGNNALWEDLMSSCLRDSEGNLLAIYKKGRGVKMVEEIEEIEEIEVSERTFNFMKDRTDYFYLYDNWKILGSEERDLALSELNDVYYNVSSLFTKLIKSEAKLVKKAKEYRIILKGLHRFEGVQAYSEYVYIKSDGTLAKTKSFDYITVMSEKSMKQLPEWAQALAEEVD